jgi:hypothetical protein
MGIRVRRRGRGGDTLEAMTDDELRALYFFGSIAGENYTIRYTAEGWEERIRARRLLIERGAWNHAIQSDDETPAA